MMILCVWMAVWCTVGACIVGIIMTNSYRIGGCIGFEWFSPIWIYKHYKVNYFGTIFLTIVFNVLCPILTIGYWFYKLCTIGRK